MCKSKFVDYYDVYSPENVEVGKTISVPNWTIVPIQCYHNVECFGYIIRNETEKKDVLFCTDTRALPKVADRLFDLMMLECNYDYESVVNNSRALKLPNDGYKNHLALETLTEWLSVRNVKPQNLMVIHISSNNNLNRTLAKEQLQPCSQNLYFAKKGMRIEI